MTYGGGPVMGTTVAGTTIRPLYWAPAGYAYQAGYQSGVDRFLADVAAGSGSLQTVFGVVTQYYQVSNGTFQYISPTIQAGSELDDSDPYPGGGCTPDAGVGFTACVTTAEIGAELRAFVASQGLGAGYADLYTILFPPNVETCFGDANAAQGGECSSATSAESYCGYHSSTPSGSSTLIFSVIPALDYCGSTPRAPSSGTIAANEMASLIAHEAIESMTDPVGRGWLDGHSREIADMCDGDFVLQTFGPGTWNVQDVFSNADYAANPASGGCTSALSTPVLTPYPFITTTTIPSPVALATVYHATLDVIGGHGPFTWTVIAGALPPGLSLSAAGEITGRATSAGRYQVTITVTDSHGDSSPPVKLSVTVAGSTVPVVTLASSTFTVRDSTIPVRLNCARAACHGSLQLIRATRALGPSLVLGSATFAIAVRASAVISLRLSVAGERIVAGASRWPLAESVRVLVRGGATRTEAVRLAR